MASGNSVADLGSLPRDVKDHIYAAVFELAAKPAVRASFSDSIRSSLAPSAEYFQTLHLPDALIHWGHPGALDTFSLLVFFACFGIPWSLTS